MIEGSSLDKKVAKKVSRVVRGKRKVLLLLDSFHTHDHVLKELELYSPLVKKNNYVVVFDTVVEDMPTSSSAERPWGKGNNPKTAVKQFLKNNKRFKVDKEIEKKLLITSCPDGFLKCVK